MVHSTLLITHVSTAVIGILSGFLSIAFRKGSGLHRASGQIFFVSMMIMAAAGAYMAEFIKPNVGNLMGGLLTMYVVATGWVAGRRRERKVSAFDWAALLMILSLMAAAVTWGTQALMSPSGTKAGYPAALFFIFGGIMSLFAASDLGMILRRGIAGSARVARHLVRMCVALLFATLSFYPSRAHLFSKAINDSKILYLPHVILIGSLLFWLYRVKSRKRGGRNEIDREDRRSLLPAEYRFGFGSVHSSSTP